MDRRTFERIRELVYEHSGIALSDNKVALVCARVGKRMRSLGIGEYRTYLKYVTDDTSGEEMVHLLDAISTNVTSFFREPVHFEFLGKVVSEWLAQGVRRYRFWSAACSSGEEPYSLAMTFFEAADGRSVDMKILATDISTRVLEKCRTGIYEKDRLVPVPPQLRQRYFDVVSTNGTTVWRAKNVLRTSIVFKRLNLSDPPFPMHGPFDAIMCRNVMIYFDKDVRTSLLAEMGRLLKPGGYLMVGHSESLTGMATNFKMIRPSIFMRT